MHYLPRIRLFATSQTDAKWHLLFENATKGKKERKKIKCVKLGHHTYLGNTAMYGFEFPSSSQAFSSAAATTTRRKKPTKTL